MSSTAAHPVVLTAAARQRIAQFTANDESALGMRFGVKKLGCSGFAYVVELAKALTPQDQVFNVDGIQVVIDSVSLPVVRGTEIDFKREGINANFAFNNPNMTGECGCGESFSVDKAAI
jgi:iron-sulfur cluster assembly protein